MGISEGFSIQAWGPEFKPSHKNPETVVYACDHRAGEAEMNRTLASLVNLAVSVNSTFNERPCLEK